MGISPKKACPKFALAMHPQLALANIATALSLSRVYIVKLEH
jgi:hypothetical protein